MIRLHNYIISILAYSCIVFSQVTLSISDYYPFPSELSDLNVNPDVLEWGVAGSFLLLDQKENQLVSIAAVFWILIPIGLVGGALLLKFQGD